MPTIAERVRAADRWLKSHEGKGHLARRLYLVPGLCDERGGCWTPIVERHGPRVFANWDDAAVVSVTFPDDGRFPAGSARAGEPMLSFWDFAERLRERIAVHHPDHDTGVGEYDLLCHSMGGLDAFAALTAAAGPAIARAWNLITCDTPFFGIPNADLRKKFGDMQGRPERRAQANAISAGSAELSRLTPHVTELVPRVVRLTCYRAIRSFYVAVPAPSSDLLRDDTPFPSRADWLAARAQVRYRALPIPGAVHSGVDGLTEVRIGIVEIFKTLLGEA